MKNANKTTRHLFHSNGKLLLTGEYLVLSGARALALPLRKGQSMEVVFTPGQGSKILWSATDPEGPWFQTELTTGESITCLSTNNELVTQRLIHLLNSARCLNPEFLSATGVYSVDNRMAFNHTWGWGASSTLISNLAWWAKVDPFQLNRLYSDGSGYDIACARAETPLAYRIIDNQVHIDEIWFHPPFHEHIVFIYLGNKKDNSPDSLKYLPGCQSLASEIEEVTAISTEITVTRSLDRFNSLIDRHEEILSNILGRPVIKEVLFPGFNGSIKSLGAWGGDFIMASSAMHHADTISFFAGAGYPVSFTWKEIIR